MACLGQKVAWDLISYSVPRNVFCEHAIDSVLVIGYFQHGSEIIRRRDGQGMLDGIPKCGELIVSSVPSSVADAKERILVAHGEMQSVFAVASATL
jgi:hypothetical protein